VGLTFFYFLLFAQFGFLHRVREVLGEGSALKGLMGAMALGGVSGAFLSALSDRRLLVTTQMMVGFGGCLLAAALTYFSLGYAFWVVNAALIGLGLGFLTVAAATHLVLLSGGGWLAAASWGTGLAYLCANFPWFFRSSSLGKTGLALGACMLGLLVLVLARRDLEQDVESEVDSKPRQSVGWGWALLLMTVVIWLDSALFLVLQQNGELKATSWLDSGQLWLNGLATLCGALVSGFVMRRSGWVWALVVAFTLLCLGAWWTESMRWHADAGAWLYSLGVGLYGPVLVALPDGLRVNGSRMTPAWRAFSLFSLAGWIGSGMGIGMAENLRRVPLAFCLVGAVLMVVVLVLGLRKGRESA